VLVGKNCLQKGTGVEDGFMNKKFLIASNSHIALTPRSNTIIEVLCIEESSRAYKQLIFVVSKKLCTGEVVHHNNYQLINS
jgi:hypothetical protein